VKYNPALLEAARDPQARAAWVADLERKLGSASLAQFVRLAWSQLEPDRLLWNWHLDAMSEALQAVALGQFRNLLINIPPGCMKSLEASTFYPAWDWIKNPTRRFIAATYGTDLSNKNAKLHRDLVVSDWYQTLFPHVKIGKDQAKLVHLFSNSMGGFRYSTTVKGGATGHHGDVIISDDLVKAQDADGRAAVSMVEIQKAVEFRFKTLITRRRDPATTAFVTIMQRLHYGDPAQRCIDSGDHVCLILPMEFDPARKCIIDAPGFRFEDPRTEPGELLWPERFPAETVKEIRKELGTVAAAAQLDQNPSPIKGAVFDRSWFDRTYEKLPSGGRMIITVDCTFKDTASSDYVSIQAWLVHKNDYYLVDLRRGQWGIKKTCLEILRMKMDHPRAMGVYVEAAANGFATVQILEDKITGLKLWAPGKSSKEERAESVSPQVESNCYFPKNAPFMAGYVTQMTQFPRGVNDDDVDATTMALLILHKTRHRRMKEAYKRMGKKGVLL